jgi:hypothetical protein
MHLTRTIHPGFKELSYAPDAAPAWSANEPAHFVIPAIFKRESILSGPRPGSQLRTETSITDNCVNLFNLVWI